MLDLVNHWLYKIIDKVGDTYKQYVKLKNSLSKYELDFENIKEIKDKYMPITLVIR